MSLKLPSFDKEESSKNIQSNMYGSTAKAISHYKDKQKFTETLNFGRKLFCCTPNAVSKKHYLWTDSSCNHGYYAHHGFEKVAEFKSDEWKTDSNDYLTYIYRKSF